MRRSPQKTGYFTPRALTAFLLVLGSVFLSILSVTGALQKATKNGNADLFGQAALAPGNISSNSSPGWSVVSSPNTTEQQLLGTTCVSANDCWAVGYYYLAVLSFSQTLTEHWDGTAWAIVPSPNAKNGTSTMSNRLAGVFCNSTSDCWAVGYSQVSTVIEHWDGAAWSIVTSPTLSSTQNQLLGVTCASSLDCWAVGSYKVTSNNATQTLIEHWNGSAWTVVTSANTSTSVFNRLTAVTCNTSLDCWTVGLAGSTPQTLTEHWNGVAWSIVTSANTSPTVSNRFTSVTCLSATECWAAGYYGTSTSQTLIERWDGSAWSIVSSPNASASQNNRLNGIVCASSSQCWAVGLVFDTQTWADLIERWDGNSWSLVTSPTNVSTQFNSINAIACSSAVQCWAVGSTDFQYTLIENWSGNLWSIAASPSAVGGGSDNSLNGVTCNTTTDCWAVGQNSLGFSFIQHWDGIRWSIVFVPIASWEYSNTLFRVACSGPNECWAVGYYNDNVSFFDHSLTVHWNGSSWSEVASPNVPNRHNYLNDVKCTAIGNCWAVGTSIDTNANITETLTEHWNGSSWSIVTSPNWPTGNAAPVNQLAGISCTSSSNCWSVGVWGDFGVATQTLVEHWDGSSWTVVSSPNVAQENQFFSVTCFSASDCWAVGNTHDPDQGLIEHWDGNSWSVSASFTSDPTLEDVACSSASNCWAVGDDGNTFSNPVILQWDGATWSTVSPPTFNNADHLYGVACPSSALCWAVGDFQVDPQNDPPWALQTLIEVYSVTTPPLTNVGSRITHGSAGTFSLDLPLTGKRAIECRRGGANGNYSVVFNFANNVTNCGTAAPAGGSVVAGPNSNQCTLNLTGVPNGQIINVELDSVTDFWGNAGNVSVPVGFLIGDTNADGFVDSIDTAQTKSQAGKPVSTTNFREDVNVDGFIDAIDVSLVKSKSGTVLNSAPPSSRSASPSPTPGATISQMPNSKSRKPSRNQ